MLIDPREQLLGSLDRLSADSNLFHDLRLLAVEGGQSSQSLQTISAQGPRNKRGCLRSDPLPVHLPRRPERRLGLVEAIGEPTAAVASATGL